MISSQILQNTIDGLKSITRADLWVLDTEGKCVASTETHTENYESEAKTFIESPADSQTLYGYHFFKVYDDNRPEYIVLTKGETDNVYMSGKLAAFHLTDLLIAYKERYDKDNFIKNLLLDNLLLIDIYNRAKKLHIDTESRRVVFLIETFKERDFESLETLRTLFSNRSKDFITSIDETFIILVKEIKETTNFDDLIELAEYIRQNLKTEQMTDVHISIGNIINDIRDISNSYKEAMLARHVGQIFYPNDKIKLFTKLGIGRLIYQLPMSLCEFYIKEVFAGGNPEDIDEETISTILKFFENNLNVSETSRQLFIHRNTLVYRLDKFQKQTKLDLRNFEDAITFKLALMVVKYMKHKQLEAEKFIPKK